MQYSFTLPADYDMAIIRRRIAEKGPMLDGFPGLLFKAYLWAERDFSRENLYAPLYLWRETEGMNRFLSGEGFRSLVAAFGRPAIRTWVPVVSDVPEAITRAAWATRTIAPMDDGLYPSDLGASTDAPDALASLSAYDPAAWSRLQFQLWQDRPDITRKAQAYRVGHISWGRD